MSDSVVISVVFCLVIVNESEFSKKLGEKIKEMRLNKKLSQFDLSIECGIPKNQIGRIERGLISPTLKTLIKISNGLSTHPKNLLDI